MTADYDPLDQPAHVLTYGTPCWCGEHHKPRDLDAELTQAKADAVEMAESVLDAHRQPDAGARRCVPSCGARLPCPHVEAARAVLTRHARVQSLRELCEELDLPLPEVQQ